MKPIEFWKLCETVSVFQATMLILGVDPGNETSHETERRTGLVEGYGAIKTALLAAIRSKQLRATVEEVSEYNELGQWSGVKPGTIDLDLTLIDVSSLIDFLRARDFQTEVFGGSGNAVHPVLDASGAFYAPKLAAALDAWVAVTAERRFETQGTPKRWIEKWLREQASRYALHKADGTLNEDAIQQIAKIVNWRPEGGAGKTAARSNPSAPPGRRER